MLGRSDAKFACVGRLSRTHGDAATWSCVFPRNATLGSSVRRKDTDLKLRLRFTYRVEKKEFVVEGNVFSAKNCQYTSYLFRLIKNPRSVCYTKHKHFQLQCNKAIIMSHITSSYNTVTNVIRSKLLKNLTQFENQMKKLCSITKKDFVSWDNERNFRSQQQLHIRRTKEMVVGGQNGRE